MNPSPLAALLHAAALFLDHYHCSQTPFSVSVTDAAGVEHRVNCASPPDPPLAASDRNGWRMFNDEEEAIIQALRGRGALTTEELARLLGRDAGTAFRCTLRGLKKRGVIEMSQTHGVRLREV